MVHTDLRVERSSLAQHQAVLRWIAASDFLAVLEGFSTLALLPRHYCRGAIYDFSLSWC
jgi:hypothetical protein